MKQIKKAIRKAIRNTPKRKNSEPQILNEAVNFNTKSIFIAIPKTGTTSLRYQVREQGTPLIKNPHLNILQVRDSLYVFFLIRALGRNEEFPSETIPTDAELHAQAKETFNTFFKFSVVRNPWARAVSLYSRREGVEIKDKISFENFCRNHIYASDTCRQPTLHKNQIDWLCDENGQYIMDYVFKLENFERAINEITELTNGRLKLKYQFANRNPNSLSSSYSELYTEETRMMIAKRFEKDIDYFKYTF